MEEAGPIQHPPTPPGQGSAPRKYCPADEPAGAADHSKEQPLRSSAARTAGRDTGG